MKKNYFTNYLHKFSELLIKNDEKNFLKITLIIKEIKKKKRK